MTLSQDEWALIERLDTVCPYLMTNFKLALSVPSDERYDWAHDRVYDIFRMRYTKRGIPLHDTETVGEHTLEAIGLATLHTPEHCNGDIVEQMILVHDLPQAILDNLRCEEDIKDEDKRALNALAAKIIFESDEHAYALWLEYEQQETLESHIAKDIQNAQMMMKILEYKATYPQIIDGFKHFLDNLEHNWLTDAGREIYRNTFKIDADSMARAG